MPKMLETYYEELMQHLPIEAREEVHAIEVTGPARWFYEDNQQEEWDVRTDFPVVVPPFHWTWLEYSAPKFINSEGQIHSAQILREIDRIGCMVWTQRVPPEYAEQVITDRTIERFIEEAAQAQGIRLHRPHSDADKRIQRVLDKGLSAGWITVWKTYISNRRGIVDGPSMNAYLCRDGQIIDDYYILFGRMFSISPFTGEVQTLSEARGIPMLFPFLFSLSLMHAKNVHLEDIPIPERVRKKREKRDKPVVQYKTLRVESIRKQSSEARNGQSSVKNALHFVRGHFKDYRQSKGLFGKYKGLYWWDMHVRGDEASGKVIKDYEVPAPG